MRHGPAFLSAFTLALVFTVASTFRVSDANAAELTIDVQGIGVDQGEIQLALYDNASAWMKKAVKFGRAPAKKGSVLLTISDIPQGEYAISMYHDENGNGKMDSNAIGIPIEPYAFSNDAMGSFGPPKFDQAKFKLDADKKTIVITFK